MKNERPRRPWRRIFGPHPDQEVDEELKFHLEQRIRGYVAQGMSPEDARRTATEKFGDVTRVRETCTALLAADRAAGERRTFVSVSWLDVKLGLRMFAKHPGLSIVAVLGMSLAVAIGAGYFGFIGALLDSPLPLDEGDRVVMIQKRFVAGPDTGDTERASEHDFVQWRGAIKSVEDLSAFRDEAYNLVAAGQPPRLVRAAAMTASAFRLTRVAPVLGRPLLDEDERPGAPPVLVLGHYDWQRHFNGEPGVLGTTVRLDETVYSIVGVMPQGFAFPRSHGYWVPLRSTAAATNPAAEPSIFVFGRLARGFSEKQAQSELATVGDQMAAAFPQTHRDTRPLVLSYTHAFAGVEGPEVELVMRSIQVGVGLLLLLVAVNVAIVVYARTATRMGEIAVRTALGASRARIVMQLFVEAIVLSVTSAVIGLTIVSVMLARAADVLNKSDDPTARLDYWIHFGTSPALIAYVALLAILSGLIVGVLPALKATGKRVHVGLQHLASRGSSMQLGRTWTALIVLQVAVTVAALPTAMYFGGESLRAGFRSAAPATRELVRGTLAITRDDATGDGGSAARARVGDPRFTDRMTTLIQRLEAEPEVSAVTFADRLPGAERGADIEVDGAPAADQPIRMYTRFNTVAANLFDVFDVPILAGRSFTAADTLQPTAGLIVDQVFAERLPGGSVLGRRVRYAQRMADGKMAFSPWFEIVGVVPAFAETITPTSSISGRTWPRMYHAAAPSQLYPATLVVRVRGGDPTRFATKLREITATVDPTLKLERVNGVLRAWNSERMAFRMMALAICAGTLSVLLLSAAGIYAMMSFTVSRRRREIGIRAALGADARRVVTGIFGRAGAQLGAGITVGLAIASAFEWLGPGGTIGPNAPIILPSVVVLMFTVGLLAAIGPARRGLAVQPIEALREE
jgi:putative ABC transport system permease protein